MQPLISLGRFPFQQVRGRVRRLAIRIALWLIRRCAGNIEFDRLGAAPTTLRIGIADGADALHTANATTMLVEHDPRGKITIRVLENRW